MARVSFAMQSSTTSLSGTSPVVSEVYSRLACKEYIGELSSSPFYEIINGSQDCQILLINFKVDSERYAVYDEEGSEVGDPEYYKTRLKQNDQLEYINPNTNEVLVINVRSQLPAVIDGDSTVEFTFSQINSSDATVDFDIDFATKSILVGQEPSASFSLTQVKSSFHSASQLRLTWFFECSENMVGDSVATGSCDGVSLTSMKVLDQVHPLDEVTSSSLISDFNNKNTKSLGELLDMVVLSPGSQVLAKGGIKFSTLVSLEASANPKDRLLAIRVGGSASFVYGVAKISTWDIQNGVVVPNLYNLPVETAKSQLSAKGLNFNQVSAPSEVIAVGHVISQNPSYNVVVPGGYVVNLVISGGVEQVSPQPSVASFELLPTAKGSSAITMAATLGTDASGGIQYLFTETSGKPGGDSSGWQDSQSYTDTGLTVGETYTYTVQVRDRHQNTNTTSNPESATVVDLDPPTPNPGFLVAPNNNGQITSISMTAIEVTDPSEPVRYYFRNTTVSGHDSGWQTSQEYTDTELVPGETYSYQVRVMDGLNNMSEYSDEVAATTVDNQAPLAGSFLTEPTAVGENEVFMEANIVQDPSGVEYQFIVTPATNGAQNSGWQDSPQYTDSDLEPGFTYSYSVQTRDKSVANNSRPASSPVAVTTTDNSPPTPDPAQIDQDPSATKALSYNEIQVTAQMGEDHSGVQYQFSLQKGSDPMVLSSWKSSPTHIFSNLTFSTAYSLRVTMRDQNSGQVNQGQTSEAFMVTTLTIENPPVGSFATLPKALGKNSVTMTAAIPSNPPEGVLIEYRFEGSGGPGVSSRDWGESPTFVDDGLEASTLYEYTVQTRYGEVAEGPKSAKASVTTSGSAIYGTFTGNTTTTNTTGTDFKWTASNFDPEGFDHSTSTNNHAITIKKDGDYQLSLTMSLTIPLATDDLRGQTIAELYVNNNLVPHGIAASSFKRYEDYDASNHFSVLLPGLKVNDVISLKIKNGANAAQSTGLGTLYIELIEPSQSYFHATAFQTTAGNNFNTASSPLRWSSGAVSSGFSLNNTEITLEDSGSYLVFFNLPYEVIDCGGKLLRVSVGGIIKVGNRVVGNASQGYTRCYADHNRSSIHWSGHITATAGEKLTISLEKQTSTGYTTQIMGINTSSETRASVLILKQPDEKSITLAMSGDYSGWNSASTLAWTETSNLDSEYFSHSNGGTNVTIKQKGIYLLVYNNYLNLVSGARVSPTIRAVVKPASGDQFATNGSCSTNYLRGSNKHLRSSCSLVYPLGDLGIGDQVSLTTQVGGASGTAKGRGQLTMRLIKEPESDPPTPDPAQFAAGYPQVMGPSRIDVVAVTGSGLSGVLYLFQAEKVTGGGNKSSGWINVPNYSFGDLTPGTAYNFTVQLKDGLDNQGAESSPVEANTNPIPIPGQGQFSSAPAPVDYQSITMAAAIPTDPGVSIEYKFQGTGGPGVSSSGWISDRTWVDTGLSKVTEYSYTVAYRFGGSKVGAPSSSLSATTLDPLLNFLDESESLCNELGWDVRGRICGSSPSCVENANLEEAAKTCQDRGARVCEADELKAANAIGCGFDGKWVWSKTSCDGGFLQVIRKTSGRSRCRAASFPVNVRCCADAVKLAQVSAKNCSQLSGWNEVSGTCGGSDEGWSCSWNKTLQQANDICVDNDARLCTVAEIPAGIGTGCRLDKSYIWTKDTCDQDGVSGYLVARGNDNTDLQCRGLDDVANVRCCAN